MWRQVLLADSLESALRLLSSDGEIGSDIESVFIMGGSALYEHALAMPE